MSANVLKMGHSGLFFVLFTFQFKRKIYNLNQSITFDLEFEPFAKDGRRWRYHWSMAATPANFIDIHNLILLSWLNEDGRLVVQFDGVLNIFWSQNYKLARTIITSKTSTFCQRIAGDRSLLPSLSLSLSLKLVHLMFLSLPLSISFSMRLLYFSLLTYQPSFI